MSGARVLIVEDEPQLRYALRRYLEENGYAVRLAQDGTSGLSEFGAFKPDVVLLDLMLPDVSGVEVCRQIRRDHETPIVVLSALGDEKTKVQALDQGADDYLTKPFDPDELRARIHVGRRTIGLMANIKRLTGLLPICSYCKRIRSDHDYWEQVESYIADHTDALFSHGICPECLTKAMNDLDGADLPLPKTRG